MPGRVKTDRLKGSRDAPDPATYIKRYDGRSRKDRGIKHDRDINPEGRVFGYGRVSTGRQTTSIQAQEKRLEGYHQSRFGVIGNKYLGFFADDDTSGRVPFREREAGGKLFGLLKPGDHVIITRPDRAFRNLADTFATLESWEHQGIYVHLVEYGVDTSTPMGKMAIAFLSLFADFERRMISDRTKDVNRERKRQGMAVGQPPIGYHIAKRKMGRIDGKDIFERRLVIDDYEIKVCRRIHLMRLNGEPFPVISQKLRAGNIKHRGGNNVWQASNMYEWSRAYRKLLAEGKIPPHLMPDAAPDQTQADQDQSQSSDESPDDSDSTPLSANTRSMPTPSHAPVEG